MSVRILVGDCRERLRDLPDASVHCVVTSPPYFGLRDYGVEGQIGLEETPDAFVAEMVAVFREVRRVLRADGTLWLNLGDSYEGARGGPQGANGQMADRSIAAQGVRVRNVTRVTGLKPKDLIGIPWRVAFALQADGWWLRQDIIWSKPNPMPESVTDRCTKAHEYLFLLTKSERYFYDAAAIKEPDRGRADGNVNGFKDRQGAASFHATSGGIGSDGWEVGTGRNKRSVWTVPVHPFAGAHFATFPPALIEPCILAGCPEGGTVLDPFGGAGTTGLVADRLGRNAILIELNSEYAAMAERRISADSRLFSSVSLNPTHPLGSIDGRGVEG